MHRSFQKWAEDFACSDELAALEDDLSIGQADTDNANRLSLDRFIHLMTQGVLEKMSDETVLNQFLNARELREDNAALALQVQKLLKDKKRLEADIKRQALLSNRFKPVMGNVYLRID